MQGFMRGLKGRERQELRDLLRSDQLQWREKEKAIKTRLQEFEALEAKTKAEDLERNTQGLRDDKAGPDHNEKHSGKRPVTREEKDAADRIRLMDEGSPYGGPAEPPPLGWQQYTIMAFAILLFFLTPGEGAQKRQLNWDEIRTMLEEGRVASVTIYGDGMVRVTERVVQQSSRPVPATVHWYEIKSGQTFQAELEQAYSEMELPWDQRPPVEVVDDSADLTPQAASPWVFLLPLVVMLPIWLM